MAVRVYQSLSEFIRVYQSLSEAIRGTPYLEARNQRQSEALHTWRPSAPFSAAIACTSSSAPLPPSLSGSPAPGGNRFFLTLSYKYLMREAIKRHSKRRSQRRAAACNPRPSEAIRGHPRPSGAITHPCGLRPCTLLRALFTHRKPMLSADESSVLPIRVLVLTL